MTKKTEGKLKYQIILDQFLKEREWSDEYEINSEEKAVSLNTGINICEGHSGRLIVEASDQTDYVDVYIYYSQTCKESKLDEMAILLNGIHRRWHFGKFRYVRHVVAILARARCAIGCMRQRFQQHSPSNPHSMRQR